MTEVEFPYTKIYAQINKIGFNKGYLEFFEVRTALQQIPRFFIKFLVELVSFASMHAPLGPVADDDKVSRHSNV